jgi:hypothetical protein
VPCGSGCWSSGYFPNKIEFIPHQSNGCLDEGCRQLQETVDGAKAAVDTMLERVNVALKDTVAGVNTTLERIEPAQI